MTLPTVDQIEQLHKKYATSDISYQEIYTHCQIVWQVAQQLIETHELTIDAELVKVGCLLHDIGAHELYDSKGVKTFGTDYITHGIRGEAILKKEGFPEVIWRFASHHTGVGLSKEQIVKTNLPLPAQDFLADSLEEKIVMYADKFHSKTKPPIFNSFEFYKQYVLRFGTANVEAFEAMGEQFGIPDLQPLSDEYGYAIR